ncbi:hypothetical protein [Hymenobacter cellulosilyticus]|uniref:Uncharacterized protein n=1 Tax=Hymenobacter cellulosilyticus TaxID=2932248 RepID=A0A8T9Q6V0_9BACT|nr:hypothetical protein [Hymenobacter cellulosilyticus]UOQ71748.1 hypothetical protein MUN79_24610 [Hymenobacter cellulosilyticus]
MFRTSKALRYQRLNHEWNAEPNAPQPVLTVEGQALQLEFSWNDILFEQFPQAERGCLTFRGCHKYSFNALNDEGYYLGQHRYTTLQLPWGEFYELFTDWQTDFPPDVVVLGPAADSARLHHFLFFLRDNTFECVAESWELRRR